MNGTADIVVPCRSSANRPIFPKVKLEMNDTSVSIVNHDDGSREFKLENLPQSNEVIMLDGETGVMTGSSGVNLYPYVLSYIRSAGVTAQTVAKGSGYVVLRVASSSSTEVDPKLAESVLIWPAVGGETICIQANPVLSASFLPAVGGVDLTITPIASGYYELHAMAENTMTLGGFISDAVYSIPVKLLDNVTIEIGPSDVLSACGMPTLLEEIDITLCGKTMEGYRTFANGNDVIDLQGNGRGVLSLYAVGDWSASVLACLIDSKTISSTRGMQCETEIGSAIRNSVIVAWAPLSQYDHSFVSDMDSIALKDLERVVIE